MKYKPSIHMPRWASRLTLIVESVKIERLQDISEEDARAEGIEWSDSLDPHGPCKWRVYGEPSTGTSCPIYSFQSLWKYLHGPDAWDQNPDVVVIGFGVVKSNIDEIKEAA